jgi:hypothetical protein
MGKMSDKLAYERRDKQICMGHEAYKELQILKKKYGLSGTAFFDIMFSRPGSIDNLFKKVSKKEREGIARARTANAGRPKKEKGVKNVSVAATE